MQLLQPPFLSDYIEALLRRHLGCCKSFFEWLNNVLDNPLLCERIHRKVYIGQRLSVFEGNVAGYVGLKLRDKQIRETKINPEIEGHCWMSVYLEIHGSRDGPDINCPINQNRRSMSIIKSGPLAPLRVDGPMLKCSIVAFSCIMLLISQWNFARLPKMSIPPLSDTTGA